MIKCCVFNHELIPCWLCFICLIFRHACEVTLCLIFGFLLHTGDKLGLVERDWCISDMFILMCVEKSIIKDILVWARVDRFSRYWLSPIWLFLTNHFSLKVEFCFIMQQKRWPRYSWVWVLSIVVLVHSGCKMDSGYPAYRF